MDYMLGFKATQVARRALNVSPEMDSPRCQKRSFLLSLVTGKIGNFEKAETPSLSSGSFTVILYY